MTETRRRYKHFDQAAREAAVCAARILMVERNYSRAHAAREVAKDIGAHRNTVVDWMAAADLIEPAGTVTGLQAQLRDLNIQLEQARAVIRQLTGRDHIDHAG